MGGPNLEKVGPKGGTQGGAPKGGAPKVETDLAKNGLAKIGLAKSASTKGWGAQNFALFFPSPPQLSFFLLSLGVLSWNLGGVFEVQGP